MVLSPAALNILPPLGLRGLTYQGIAPHTALYYFLANHAWQVEVASRQRRESALPRISGFEIVEALLIVQSFVETS